MSLREMFETNYSARTHSIGDIPESPVITGDALDAPLLSVYLVLGKVYKLSLLLPGMV